MNRREKAIRILNKHKPQSYYYLGEGWEGIIFHDKKYVYKVFIPQKKDGIIKDTWKFGFLHSKIGVFKNRKHLVELLDLIKVNNVFILKYLFAEFTPVDKIEKQEAISFLTECWQEKVIFRDVKMSNFIRVNNVLRYIDYGYNQDFTQYNDNYFLNMAARIYIDIKFPDIDNELRLKIKRTSINNFHIPELEGFHGFLNKVFSNIIFEESKLNSGQVENTGIKVSNNEELIEQCTRKPQFSFSSFDNLNLEKVFWDLLSKNIRLISITPNNFKLNENLYHEPVSYTIRTKKLNIRKEKISLLIKACPQESSTIYQQVKHIIKQLTSPDVFFEKVLAIDKKENHFLRQYTDEGNLEELYKEVNRLINEKIIDYFIELPDDKIIETNINWFNLETKETHTIKNIPVTPQLYAFEQVKGDYILQMDADVIIGRSDYDHSFLDDMIAEFQKNPNVISVGFNIPKNKDVFFTEYHAPANGGYVPEVRMGLFHKNRLLNARPLPNRLINEKLELSWYRSLHLFQKQTGYTSLRGGNPKSYYIHPQNYRKKCKDVWFTILDRVENNIIPDIQRENFDLAGSYYDWTLPKRNEHLIIVTLLYNIDYNRFLRTWNSIISQTYKNFGWIIIDDASDNGIDILLRNLINNSPLKENITFIKNRLHQGIAANTYKAIHYFIQNPNSIVMIVDGDDALLGKETLNHIVRQYEKGHDVIIGKMYRTDKLFAHYPYQANFTNPRLTGGNVWQHIRSFKKFLFDSIKLYDLKHDKKLKTNIDKPLSMLWFKHCVDYAYMVPIVEMSSNPKQIEIYNYYHERSTPATSEIKKEKEKIIAEILNRPKYSKTDVIKENRIDFLPDINKIEIDITYDCNLKCISCNRSCTQAPAKDYISLSQINKFIEESIEMNKKWEFINILGGEPTLHPYFEEIINLILNKYILKFSRNTILQITSNGYTKESRDLLKKFKNISNIQIDYNSFKTSNKVEYFTPFNIAPIDVEEFKNKYFSKACWVTSYCGIGLNKYGYYPCGVAGSIDRVIGYDLGVKSLKAVTQKKMKELLNTFCRFCGNYIDYDDNAGNFISRCEKAPLTKNKVTITWKKFYKNYQAQKPKLTKIYE